MVDKKKGRDKKLKNLEKELEKCEKLKEEYLAGWQRCRADFLNYKKEEIEREERVKEYAREKLILKILDIYDYLEMAVKNMPKEMNNSQWTQGISQIYSQFSNWLKEEKVEKMRELDKFNPEFHEAVAEVDSKDKKKGEIAEVLKKGYLINGRLLRPAKVKVVK